MNGTPAHSLAAAFFRTVNPAESLEVYRGLFSTYHCQTSVESDRSNDRKSRPCTHLGYMVVGYLNQAYV